MKTLIIDDDQEKIDEIRKLLIHASDENSPTILCAFNFAEAIKEIQTNQFDLIIVDLMLPMLDGGTPQSVGHELLGLLATHKVNRSCSVIALTAYPDLVKDERPKFEAQGVLLVEYNRAGDQWRKTLTSIYHRIRIDVRMDFLIFCALEKERKGYAHTPVVHQEKITAFNLDTQYMNCGDFRGACVLLPSMGLVMATSVASRAIEIFQSSVVAMSGLCAGIRTYTKLGQILIGNPCWEYQSGKWANNAFQIEPYQVSLDEDVRLTLKSLLSDQEFIQSIDNDINAVRSPQTETPKILPCASGSAVITDESRIDAIGEQHRKVAGIDMELFGIYQSARLASCQPKFFGAKTVVDYADDCKGDELHEYGCIVSARFTFASVELILSNLK